MSSMNSSEFTKKIPLELLCMLLLEERDMYGYEMMLEMRKRSEGIIDVNLATLYFALKRLSENGCVTSYDVPGGRANERNRQYYHLEEPAKPYMAELRSTYDRAQHGVALFFQSHEGSERHL